ncbi:thiamine-phosphate synthase [Clostridium botulinum]|uniref:Thiamine-phosphate synthase n=1 Tax=Clostridium botulinum C/D str. DC5 TaxID=1443128 RepID=A0A0A0IDY6_CLOBO|nr:thiamine phosphate synthase [Clostridium botulinum]KEI01170.1 thiamine-phosphate synthase [Clostridium botulinum C/D str. BKT75002]KEI13351.1 thiamine-phosphate synthase [Clostridium botulinum C/D str. BKT2873]KGM98486.1 thiamine-phosphate synthase [Clostridium botulinum D str. CCUG 7971]KGM98703.1 thiamine-phosphate synthase [Clostridium botulinum C/D str. DC5]KOC47166.1 thiamine-phosphate synthase [Clostridium botulinum]
MDLNYKLYLITDRSFLDGRSLADCVENAIKGGTTLVQVREKNISTREFFNIAKEVQNVTSKYNIPLLINDRIDIALAINADGVHLGQSDMPIDIARKILGPTKIIGISAGNINEAKEAENNGADYVGLGAVFFTGTKRDIDEPIGLKGLNEITKNINIPSVAIGGINRENAKSVLETGVNGISVISAILNKDNIKQAAEELLNI